MKLGKRNWLKTIDSCVSDGLGIFVSSDFGSRKIISILPETVNEPLNLW